MRENRPSRHACQKREHSCMRNVISFARLPAKRVLRLVSRAVHFLIQVFQPSWELPNVKEMYSTMVRDFRRLCSFARRRPEHQRAERRCLCCGSVITCPQAHQADASRAFEGISSKVLDRSTSRLFMVASQRLPIPILTVSTRAKAQVKVGGGYTHEAHIMNVLRFAALRERSLPPGF